MVSFKDKLLMSAATVKHGHELFWLNQPFQPTEEDKIILHPNPAVDYINIIPPVQFNFRTYTVRIYNLLGQKVHESNEMGDRLQISTSGLVPGMYILQLDDVAAVKFIKH
jgi:hypothetical protein